MIQYFAWGLWWDTNLLEETVVCMWRSCFLEIFKLMDKGNIASHIEITL